MPLTSADIARLYHQDARRLAGFFMRRTHDPDIALDLVAETFARVVHDRRQFRGRGDDAARGWIFGIAHNLLNRSYRDGEVQRRAMTRRGIERPELGEAEIERLVDLAGLAETRARVAEEMQALPDEQREAVQLRVVAERSYEEVAGALGISLQTARARVSRGLRALASALGDPLTPEQVRRHG